MKVLQRGAEAIIYLDEYEGQLAVFKERIKKSYRIEELDKKLRKFRSRKEAKLLNEARKIGVATPKILNLDEEKGLIVMEYIDGIRIKEFLEKCDKKEVEKILRKIGELVGKLHSYNLIHGDLTTSNLILKSDKIYFIDFGLGEFSQRIEDKAVELRLFEEALKATHFKIFKIAWKNFINGYKKEYKDADKVLLQLEKVKKRVRYAKR